MANHPSAEKRNRQRITRTERNRATKSALRTEVKKARKAIGEKAGGAAEEVRSAVSKLDRTAAKGAIPRRRANRLKSRLAKAIARAAKASG
jgi:small subunit ribosomal protein S20